MSDGTTNFTPQATQGVLDSGKNGKPWLCTTPTPLTCPRRTPSPGAVSALQASIHRLSIDTIELYERNMIDELALRLVHGDLPVGS